MSKKTDEDYNEGIELWHRVVETVKAYSVDKLTTSSVVTVKSKPAKKKVGTSVRKPTAAKAAKVPRADAKIDLHGMTQDEAFSVLKDFIPSCASRNVKAAFIVTGKGKDSAGVLKRMVPLWLEGSQFKKYIRSVSVATPQQGGAGRLFVTFK